MDIEVLQPSPAPAAGRTLDVRGRGSPWAALLCRSTRVVRSHAGASSAGCGSRGCLPCARSRLGRWAARLRDARLSEGSTARMVVLTAPPLDVAEDVPRFLAAVRAFCAYLYAQGVPHGAWVGEVVVREDQPSSTECPLCSGPPPVWALERLASAVLGRRVSAACEALAGEVDLAVLARAHDALVDRVASCPACGGCGRLPRAHLHAHLVVAYDGWRDWSAWWAEWRRLTGCATAWLGVDRRPASDPAGYLSKAVSEYVSKVVADPDGTGVDAVEWVADLQRAARHALVAACWYGATRTRGAWGAWAGEPARPIGCPPPDVRPGGGEGVFAVRPPALEPVARWDDGAVLHAPDEGRWLRPAGLLQGDDEVAVPAPAACSFSVLGRLNGAGLPVPADAYSGAGERPGSWAPGGAPDGCAVLSAPGTQPAGKAAGAVAWATVHHRRRGVSRLRVAVGADLVGVLRRHLGGDALVVAAGGALSVPARRGVPAGVLDRLVVDAVRAWWSDRESTALQWAAGFPVPAPVYWSARVDAALTLAGYPPVALVK